LCQQRWFLDSVANRIKAGDIARAKKTIDAGRLARA
jgi:hypothetical protein